MKLDTLTEVTVCVHYIVFMLYVGLLKVYVHN